MAKVSHLFPSCQVSILGDPPKDVNLPQGAFLNVNNVFPSGKVLYLHCGVLIFPLGILFLFAAST